MSNSNSELDEAIESFVQSDQTVKKEQQLQQSSVHDNEDGDLPLSEESSAAVERRQAFEKVVELIPTRVSFATLLYRMREYLTHKDVRTRQSSMELLSDLVWYRSSEDGTMLKQQEVPSFLEFVASRLGDFPSVRMCLTIIKGLLHYHFMKLPKETPVTIYRAILKELHVPSMEQALRQPAFEILDFLVSNAEVLDQLNESCIDFVALFVEAMEGEKDPRCLLICLRIVEIMLRKWGAYLDEMAESVFDVTGCYFPVTFTPPPNDPHGIKKEHLVHALEDTLTAHSCLATYVFPLALEKLSSTIPAAKIDALRLIRLGVQRYGLQTCDRFMRDICDAIRNEGTHGSDENVISEALISVSSITNEIGADAEQAELRTSEKAKLDYYSLPPATDPGPTKCWDEFVLPCVKSSLQEIERAADSLVGRSSARLLLACAQGNGYSLARVLRAGFSMVSDLYHSPTGSKPAVRAAALRLIVGFVACIDRGIDYKENEHPFQPWVESVTDTLTSVLLHGDSRNNSQNVGVHVGGTVRESRTLAVHGLRDLLLRPPSPLIGHEKQYKLIEQMADIVLDDPDHVVREKCAKALASLSSEKHHIRDAISSVVVPTLASAINKPFVESNQEKPGANVFATAIRALRAVPRLCVGHQLVLPVLHQLAALAIERQDHLAILRATQVEESVVQSVCDKELNTDSAEYGITNLPLSLRCSGFILFTICELLRLNEDDKHVVSTVIKGRNEPLLVAPEKHSKEGESLMNILLRFLGGLALRKQLPVRVCNDFISHNVKQLFKLTVSNLEGELLSALYADVVHVLMASPHEEQSSASNLLSQDVVRLMTEVIHGNSLESFTVLQILLVLLTYAPPDCLVEVHNLTLLLKELGSIFLSVPKLREGSHDEDLPSLSRVNNISDSIGWTIAAVLNRQVGLMKPVHGLGCLKDGIAEVTNQFNPYGGNRPIQAVKGLIWVTKALSMVSHKKSRDLIEHLCQCIMDVTLNEEARTTAAQGLGTIIRDEEPLTRDNGCYVNPLYRQKCSSSIAKQLGLWNTNSKGLPKDFLQNTQDTLSPRLLGICCLMADAPATLLMEWSSNGELIPLVIVALQNALKVKEQEELSSQRRVAESVTVAALRVLSAIIEKADSRLISMHLQSVIPPLLRLADRRVEGNPLVRSRCIETLIYMTRLPYQSLFPYKQQVAKALLCALEDPKRVVRRRAVTCRNEWLTISAST
eukprot:gb/GECG01006016.1/.p1 GENE.gb/GECG01006016.1/~~gb/GECG01006016.1/.p1  ORF type:complete len:1217 (+),score=156.50 gb/GECG01006016.1/:1-3651(+)